LSIVYNATTTTSTSKSPSLIWNAMMKTSPQPNYCKTQQQMLNSTAPESKNEKRKTTEILRA
jgi:hypothetical protein